MSIVYQDAALSQLDFPPATPEEAREYFVAD
jgi:hypothetical protein